MSHSFLEKISESNKLEYLSKPVIKNIIDYKWKLTFPSVYREFKIYMIIIMLIFLVCTKLIKNTFTVYVDAGSTTARVDSTEGGNFSANVSGLDDSTDTTSSTDEDTTKRLLLDDESFHYISVYERDDTYDP